MVSIPSIEPKQVRAGDTWQWTKSLSDYPSTTWALNYYLRLTDDPVARTFTAAADGNGGYAITVAASVTSEYPPRNYTWVARVSASGVVHTVAHGFLQILADLSDLANDHRTYNQRCLDAIEAVRENRANTDQAAFSVEGRSVSRMTWDELENAWHKFRNLVAKEQGIKVGRVIARM